MTTIEKRAEDLLREKVFIALGEISMCWSPIPTGVFESTKAKEIGDRLMTEISETVTASFIFTFKE